MNGIVVLNLKRYMEWGKLIWPNRNNVYCQNVLQLGSSHLHLLWRERLRPLHAQHWLPLHDQRTFGKEAQFLSKHFFRGITKNFPLDVSIWVLSASIPHLLLSQVISEGFQAVWDRVFTVFSCTAMNYKVAYSNIKDKLLHSFLDCDMTAIKTEYSEITERILVEIPHSLFSWPWSPTIPNWFFPTIPISDDSCETFFLHWNFWLLLPITSKYE